MNQSSNGHSREPIPPTGQAISDEDWERLEPGDAVIFWLKGSRIVDTIFDCSEVIEGRTIRWRWIFLDDGQLLEHSPDGEWLYPDHEIVRQGSPFYEELLAEDGALVRFEERVRAQTSARQPVYVMLRDKRYRITSTGTFGIRRKGKEPSLLPWQTFATEAKDNVYFGLVNSEDEDDGVLGIWTGHVCLSFGQALAPTDIEAVYRKNR